MSPSLSVLLLTKLYRDISMLFLLIMATSAWGFPELWGGGIPTSESFHSTLRLRRLLLLFNPALPLHFFLLPLSRLFFSPSFLPPPHPYPFLFQSFWIFTPSPPNILFLSANHLDVPPPETRQPPPLVPLPCAMCLHRMSLQWWCDLPFDTLSLHTNPYQPMGDSPVAYPPRLCVTALSSPSFPPNIWIIRFWCPCRVPFRKKARGQGAYTPWKSRTLVLTTRYLTILELFRLTGYPLP